MLSRERRSDLSVCVPSDPALEEEAVAAEQAVPDRRARCSGEEAGPDADDPAPGCPIVAGLREHDRRAARRRETGAGRDAAGVAAA